MLTLKQAAKAGLNRVKYNQEEYENEAGMENVMNASLDILANDIKSCESARRSENQLRINVLEVIMLEIETKTKVLDKIFASDSQNILT